MNNNQVAKQQNFSVYLAKDSIKNMINSVIGGEKGQSFMTAIISSVSNNPALQDCENSTILSAALIGESLNLSPATFLGQYFMVPFNDKKNNRKVAQFQIGYKGYIQLAIRSGYYKKLNVTCIKEGELKRYNPLDEEIEVQLITDDKKRAKAKTIGYYAMFEYTNGFKKSMYWSFDKMVEHANTYSQAFRARKGYSFWEKDFDSMATKTMIRQLISKWGIMSTELQKAYINDMAVLDENGINYIDNPQDKVESNANTGEFIGEVAPEEDTSNPAGFDTSKFDDPYQ